MYAKHCDGPECDTWQREIPDSPDHFITATTGPSTQEKHFCTSACATRYFAERTRSARP